MDDGILLFRPMATEGPVVKIADSAIVLGSEHASQEKYIKKETLTVWKTGQGQNISTAAAHWKGATIALGSLIAKQEATQVKISQKALLKPRHVKGILTEVPVKEGPITDLKMMILKALIEKFTGKLEIFKPKEIAGVGSTAKSEGDNVQVEVESEMPTENQSAGYGLIYEYQESYREYEKLEFSASAVIKTEDGKEVSFNTSFTMSREFIAEKKPYY